ncbi:MAG TPA: hypothetical protein VEB42_01820, partial [Chitinophagaceae bacterium]|nr:hypothetical protein [Chitinophagaceae bacterium]
MRKTLLSFAIIVLMSLCGMTAKSQTTLTAGDIAFVGYNADAVYDDFTFVLLKNISASTTINFTDFGWCSDINGFQKPNPCGLSTGAVTDGAITWTATSALPSGTQVTIQSRTMLTATVGTVTGLLATSSLPTDYMTLATGGDQIFAFQGTLTSPTLIAGISMDGAWLASLTQCQFTSSQSALPSQLNSTNSIAIVPEVDNAAYNCSITTTTPAELRSAVLNLANWLVNDATPFIFPMCT